eukprot:Nk52_evm9s2506 gene=Nk52_evmTU9s2506
MGTRRGSGGEGLEEDSGRVSKLRRVEANGESSTTTLRNLPMPFGASSSANVTPSSSSSHGVSSQPMLTQDEFVCFTQSRDVDTVREALLNFHPRININLPDSDGRTPIYYACVTGNLAVLQLLVGHGADIHSKNHGGLGMPLHTVAEHGHVKCTRYLLSKGADVHRRDAHGNTALMCAARAGQIETFRVLMRAGADSKSNNNHNNTCLHLAVQSGCSECVRECLVAGCDPNALTHEGMSAIHYAVADRHLECLKVLVDMGCDLDAVEGDYGWTVLHMAASDWYHDALKIVLDNGGDINKKGIQGDTPFHCLFTSEHMEEDHESNAGNDVPQQRQRRRSRTSSVNGVEEEVDGESEHDGGRSVGIGDLLRCIEVFLQYGVNLSLVNNSEVSAIESLAALDVDERISSPRLRSQLEEINAIRHDPEYFPPKLMVLCRRQVRILRNDERRERRMGKVRAFRARKQLEKEREREKEQVKKRKSSTMSLAGIRRESTASNGTSASSSKGKEVNLPRDAEADGIEAGIGIGLGITGDLDLQDSISTAGGTGSGRKRSGAGAGGGGSGGSTMLRRAVLEKLNEEVMEGNLMKSVDGESRIVDREQFSSDDDVNEDDQELVKGHNICSIPIDIQEYLKFTRG